MDSLARSLGKELVITRGLLKSPTDSKRTRKRGERRLVG